MFSDKMKSRLAGLALAGAVLAIPASAMAGVVVKSSGPSSSEYPVGTEVPDSSTITLRAGDKITVLTERGTRVMQGPGTFRVGEGATRTRTRFSNLTRRGASSRARTGAVRGTEGEKPTRPRLWFVDVSAAGPMCLIDFDRIRLWRPETDTAQTYSIVDQTSQDSLDVTFVGEEEVRAVDPQGLAVRPGSTYRITAPVSQETGEAPSVEVTFVQLEGDLAAPDQLASALFSAGCMAQLELMADVAEAEAERRGI